MCETQQTILLVGLVDLDTNHGDAQHFRSLRKYLDNEFDVLSITINGDNTLGNYPVRFPKHSIYRQVYWNVYISFLILKIWIRRRPQLMYMRPMGAIIAPLMFCRILGIKVGIEINGILIEGYQNKPTLHKILQQRYKSILQKAEVVAASKGYALLMKKYYGVQEENLTYLTLGYHKLNHNNDRISSREKLGLDRDLKYLLFVGNVNKYQGLQYIIQTIVEKYDEFREESLRLLIVGDGTFLEELKEIVNSSKINDVVTFIGRVDKATVQHYLSIGAIGLSPFDHNRGDEGSISGLKTYDYLFHKMPILTSKMDDAADMILEKGFGGVIYEFTIEEIWEKVRSLFSEKQITNISHRYENEYNWIINTFSWDNRFSKISKRIKSVLEQ